MSVNDGRLVCCVLFSDVSTTVGVACGDGLVLEMFPCNGIGIS